MSTLRHSKIAYVAARLQLPDGENALLLRAHEKWGDFSLLGGHVESEEVDDWSLTARREAAEEMEPLEACVHFDVARLPVDRSEWGPVPSRSAGGQSTCYEAEWFSLKFLVPPNSVLPSIDASKFAVIGLDAIGRVDSDQVASILVRLRGSLGDRWDALPLAWPDAVDVDALGIERLGRGDSAHTRTSEVAIPHRVE